MHVEICMCCLLSSATKRFRPVGGDDGDACVEDDDSKLSQAELDKIAVSFDKKILSIEMRRHVAFVLGPVQILFFTFLARGRAQCIAGRG